MFNEIKETRFCVYVHGGVCGVNFFTKAFWRVGLLKNKSSSAGNTRVLRFVGKVLSMRLLCGLWQKVSRNVVRNCAHLMLIAW